MLSSKHTALHCWSAFNCLSGTFTQISVATGKEGEKGEVTRMLLCKAAQVTQYSHCSRSNLCKMPSAPFLFPPQNLLGLPLVSGLPACSYHSSPDLPGSCPSHASLFLFFSPTALPVLGLCPAAPFAYKSPPSLALPLLIHQLALHLVLSALGPF